MNFQICKTNVESKRVVGYMRESIATIEFVDGGVTIPLVAAPKPGESRDMFAGQVFGDLDAALAALEAAYRQGRIAGKRVIF